MKATLSVTFTQDEIETIIKTLNILSSPDNDEDWEHWKSIDDLCNKAFEPLAELLCYDPEGEKAYKHEGWA